MTNITIPEADQELARKNLSECVRKLPIRPIEKWGIDLIG